MGISIDNSRLAEIVNTAIARQIGTEETGTVKVEAQGQNLSVTYTKPGDTTPVTQVIALEEAADGGILADPAAIQRLMDKISTDFNVDKKDVEAVVKNIRAEIDAARKSGQITAPDGTTVPVASLNNTYLCIFAIMAVLQKAVNTMREAALVARQSALANEIQAIENQAAKEEDAAWTGLWTAIAVGLVQITVEAAVKTMEIRADKNASQELTRQNADMNRSMMENTRILGSSEAAASATDARQALARDVNTDTANKLMSNVGGFGDAAELQGPGDPPTVASMKMTLEQKIEARNTVEKAEITEANGKFGFDGQQHDTKDAAVSAQKAKVSELNDEIADLKGKIVEKADAEVDGARAKLEAAQNELAEMESSGEFSSEAIKEQERTVGNLRKDCLYANAVRTELLATPVKGEKLITPQQAKMRIGEAQRELRFSHEAALNSAAHESWRISSEQWGAAGKCLDYFFGALNSLTQQLPQFQHAEATKQGEQVKQAESDYTSAEATLQAINETQHKILQAYQSIIDSWIRSSQCMA